MNASMLSIELNPAKPSVSKSAIQTDSPSVEVCSPFVVEQDDSGLFAGTIPSTSLFEQASCEDAGDGEEN
jgi:hypothetical protein